MRPSVLRVVALVLVATACGSVGGMDLLVPPPPSDAGGGSSSSTTSSSTSSTSSTSSSSSSTSSSSGDVPDADVPDAASPDASDGAVCLPAEICGDAIDNDCNGTADDGCGGLGTYVSEAVGKPGNPGTQAAPVATIAEGVANAVKLGGGNTVYVAEGNYPEKITLTEGVSLLGGHQCSPAACTWARDPKSYDTAIDDQDPEGVLAPSTVTKKTRVEGFRIRAKGSACMTIDGGTPIVRDNTFVVGTVTGRAVGITVFGPMNDPAGVTIEGNAIGGGTATTAWVGIGLDRRAGGAANAVARIAKNSIRGGSGAASFGISAGSSAPETVIHDNDITAGPSTGGGGSWGIQVSSSLTIDANRINTDATASSNALCSAQTVCGGIISQSSTTTITNNVVFGVRSTRSTAVLLAEAEGPPGPVVLNGNYLDGGGRGTGGALRSISSAVWLRICQGPSCGIHAVLGRLRNNVFVGGNNEDRYGVYEEEIPARTAHPDKLDADDFFFTAATGRSDVLYHFWNGTKATDLKTTDDITSTVPSNPAPSNLFTVDPLVDKTFHLTPASTLADKGTSADAPSTDFDGQKRPIGVAVDIGPDEAR